MNIQNTPTKSAKRVKSTSDTSNSFCRICKCSFKVTYGNFEKTKQISTVNIFKVSKGETSTLADDLVVLGVAAARSSNLSERVCKSCYLKVRKVCKAIQLADTIKAELNKPHDHFLEEQDENDYDRLKRLLPTSVESPESSFRFSFASTNSVNIKLLPNPVGRTAKTSWLFNKPVTAIFCSGFRISLCVEFLRRLRISTALTIAFSTVSHDAMMDNILKSPISY